MAQFSQLVITNKGQALIAKMMIGTGGVQFTKVCTSNTEYEFDNLQSLTDLTNIRQTSLISKVTRTNEVAIKIESVFTNTDVTVGYYVKSIGLYAVDPDEGEILYAVTIEQSGNCYMPPNNGTTVTGMYLKLITAVGNAENVSLDVDAAAVATIGDIQELQEQIADLQAFIGYVDEDIYGLEVDFMNNKFTRLAGAKNRTAGTGFDNINAFGGRKRCIMTNDGVVLAYYGEAGYTTTGKLTQAVTIGADPENEEPGTTYPVGTIVQVMVEQPKFYYKVVPLEIENRVKGGVTRKVRYYVSDTAKAGFKLHPAFMCDGKENDKIYLAAFEGTLWDSSASAYILDDAQIADFNTDMLCSIANAKPMSGLTQQATRANVRKLAQKRGTGWEQSYAATVCASELLMIIEYGTLNMQTAIGLGAVSKTDDSSTNMSEITGATVNLGNASGTVTNNNNVQFISYRGEENFWGNIWTWIDGFNHQIDLDAETDNVYIADNNFADDISNGAYKEALVTPSLVPGYISAFCYCEEFDWLFLAGEVLGNSALPVGDYFYQATGSGWRVGGLGGRWDDGANAGAFCWYLYYASSHRDRDVGGRLVYVPSKAA